MESEIEKNAARYKWIQDHCFEVRLSYRTDKHEFSFGYDKGPGGVEFLNQQIDQRMQSWPPKSK